MSSVEHGAPGNVLLEVLSRGGYDQDTWERTAAILSEITNHSAKENAPQLDRANSSSLQRRTSSLASSLPDSLDAASKPARRIPHSAYMCTDAKQSHTNTLTHLSALQPAEGMAAAQQPQYMPQHAAPITTDPKLLSWNLHSAVVNRNPVSDLPAQQAHPVHQAQQAKHAQQAQPNFNRLYNPNTRGGPPIIEPTAEGDWPAHIVVQCNGNIGKFMLGKQSMVCMCKLCQVKAAKAELPYTEMTPTEFERHSGGCY